MNKVKEFIYDNKTTFLFIVLCIIAIYLSQQPLDRILQELISRVGRNTFLILALLIPIQAGMGLNFAIVIGAMAAQFAVFLVSLWGITGMTGFIVCVLLTLPLSAIFGWLVGNLFNSMKGSEMIGGITLGYFAEGLYQFLFLYLLGGVIHISNKVLMISSGIGVKNTIDLAGTLRYALDDIWKMSFLDFASICILAVALYNAFRLVTKYRTNLKAPEAKVHIVKIVICAAGYGLTFIPYVEKLLLSANVPMITFGIIGLSCLFNVKFMKTIIGQNMRTVGQNMGVATASGIKVDKVRVIAIVISTILAGWGQLIYLQNMGTFQTYGAHTYTGLFSIAALLVGGASVNKASYKQALLGVVLFHTLFIVSPFAGKNLFNNAQIGEYFRVFVSYGVIAVSLALHAWKKTTKKTSA